MKRELLWNNYAKPMLRKESSVSIPSIRNLPQFDPDAEIASLTLTIPSWNSSIERVLKVSDFKIASDTAKYKLKYQLMCLISTTNNILKKIGGNIIMDGNTEDLQKFVPQVHFEQIPIKNLCSNQDYQRNLSIKHVQRCCS